jgi:hypothetical protein
MSEVAGVAPDSASGPKRGAIGRPHHKDGGRERTIRPHRIRSYGDRLLLTGASYSLRDLGAAAVIQPAARRAQIVP